MGTVIIRAITEEEYLELKKAQSTLNKILSKWDDLSLTENHLKDGKHDNDNVVYPLLKGKELVKTTDIDILNKYPIEVNSFSSIFQIDLHLITKKVRNIWDTLSKEEKELSIKNALKYKKYENSRLKEPNLLYYLQDKKFKWNQFNT